MSIEYVDLIPCAPGWRTVFYNGYEEWDDGDGYSLGNFVVEQMPGWMVLRDILGIGAHHRYFVPTVCEDGSVTAIVNGNFPQFLGVIGPGESEWRYAEDAEKMVKAEMAAKAKAKAKAKDTEDAKDKAPKKTAAKKVRAKREGVRR